MLPWKHQQTKTGNNCPHFQPLVEWSSFVSEVSKYVYIYSIIYHIYIRYFTTRNWKEPHPSRDMWHVMSFTQFSPHAWVPLKAPSRGPESEKLLVETSGNFALRKVFGWMPFPNNMSFAVFSHSKGLGAKWHVCCWGILSDSCLETNFCKKKCVAIGFFQVGDMMLFLQRE